LIRSTILKMGVISEDLQSLREMTKQEKKLRKKRSIEIYESKKVDQWKNDDVYTDISVFDWVEVKSTYSTKG
jgi:hypothetical protein